MIKEKVEIIPIVYGRSLLSEKEIFRNGSDALRKIVFKIYLIKTKGRHILVDAGCETMPGFDMEDFIGSIGALKKIGVEPSDISDVIITHAHHDHIECVKYFTHADIYIQKDEYEAGRQYFSRNQKVVTFEDALFVSPDIKIVKIGGHSAGSSIVEISNDKVVDVIVGDEIYLRECILKQRPTGASYDPKKSMDFIKKYSESTYHLHLCHDN